MTVNSKSVPTTNKIFISGGTAQLKNLTNLDSDRDDNFADTFDPSLWTVTANSNVTVTTSPFKIQFDAGSSAYELESTYSVNAASNIGFCVNFDFKQTAPATLDMLPLVMTLYQSATVRVLAQVTFSDGAGARLSMFVQDAGDYVAPLLETFNLDCLSGKLQLLRADNGLHVYIINECGYQHLAFYTWTPTTTYIIRLGCQDPQASGSVMWSAFQQLPIIYGSEYSTSSKRPVARYKNGNMVEVNFQPSLPGDFDLTVHGTGSTGEGVSQVVSSISVEESIPREEPLGFVISDVKKLYTDATEVTLCPSFATPDPQNRGDVVITNKCFCDGSPRDPSATDIEVTRYGKFDIYSDRKNLPEFIFKDDDTKYGCNFEFNRIIQPDENLVISNEVDDERLFSLKQLNLSDGRVMYYGVAYDQATNLDMFFDITYVDGASQIANPGLVYDEWYWEIAAEDGTIVQTPTNDPITVLNRANPGNIPTTHNLAPGRYYFKVEMREYTDDAISDPDASKGNQGGIYGNVYRGTTALDPKVGETFASLLDFDQYLGSDADREFGVSYINFEIAEERGYFVAYIFDPCAGTTTMYESNYIDVSMSTCSMKAIEMDDGDVVFFYQEHATAIDPYYSQRSNNIKYRVFNGTDWEATAYDIEVPISDRDDEYIHAFDIVKNGDEMKIFLSIENNDDYLTLQYKGIDYKRTRSFFPSGRQGLFVHTIPEVSFWTWEQTYILPAQNLVQIPMESYSATIRNRTLINFDVEDSASIGYPFPTRIKAYYDEGISRFVISTIDANTRAATVLAGNGETFKELALVRHFDTNSDLDNEDALAQRYMFEIDDFDAVVGYDGMVYTIASKGDLVEMGVVDPYIIWSDKQGYADSTVKGFKNTNLYQSQYRMDTMPFLSIDIDGASERRCLVNMGKNHQYLSAMVQVNTWSYMPMVFQNSRADVLPMETTAQNIWCPEFENNTTAYLSQNNTFNLTYNRLQNLQLSQSDIKGSLSTSTTARYEYFYMDRGYKFHTRVKTNLDEGIDFTEPCYFEAQGLQQKVESPFTALAGRVRMVVNGTTIDCQYYDFVGASWATVHQFTGLLPEILDLYILLKSIEDEDVYHASFIVKQPDHPNSVDATTHRFDFINSMENQHSQFSIDGDNNTGYTESYYHVYFEANGVSDRTEYMDVYHMGYNLLQIDVGLFDQVDIKGGAEKEFVDDGFEGARLREFDDTKVLFKDAGVPQYAYKSFLEPNSDTTNRYHWFNGFSFAMSQGTMYPLDSWAIQREAGSFLDDLKSDRVHGAWASESDAAQFTIWADSQDSELPEFRADTFLVTGSNMGTVRFVGKDNIGDPWTTITEMDMTRYSLTPDSIFEEDTAVLAKKADMSLSIGAVIEHSSYYKEGANRALLARNNGEDFLVLKKVSGEPALSATQGNVISSRKVVKIDAPVCYRYIGAQFDSYETYEGYFKLHAVDFGVLRDIPLQCNYDLGGGMTTTYTSTTAFVENNQPYSVNSKVDKREFDFNFTLLDANSFIQTLSMIKRTGMDTKPFWTILGPSYKPNDFYLCSFAAEPNHRIVVEEDSDRYYSFNMKLRSLE